MRTLAEMRKRYVVLDPLSMTRKFDKYMEGASAKFDRLCDDMTRVVTLLEQIEKNTRPPTVTEHPIELRLSR